MRLRLIAAAATLLGSIGLSGAPSSAAPMIAPSVDHSGIVKAAFGDPAWRRHRGQGPMMGHGGRRIVDHWGNGGHRVGPWMGHGHGGRWVDARHWHGGHDHWRGHGYWRGGVWYGFGAPAVSVSYGHVWGGNRYCWYGGGWHGAGWYRCGYGWRTGYGWGGVSGWNGWAVAGGPAVSVGIAPVSYHVWSGNRFCWYDGGWHGPGWYRCGYGWRTGYGWGGGWGWNGWAVSSRHWSGHSHWRDYHWRDHHGRDDHHWRDHRMHHGDMGWDGRGHGRRWMPQGNGHRMMGNGHGGGHGQRMWRRHHG